MSRGILIIIIAVAAVVVITCIVFSIPFNDVPVHTVEIYQETKTKQESYTETESYVTTEIVEKVETLYNGSPISVPHGISVKFEITQPGTRLISSFRLPDSGGFRLYDAPTGKILYEQLAIHGEVDMALGNGEYEVVVREGSAWGQPLDLRVQLKWSGPEEVTRYREVTKSRDVPYTVEKQQTVTTYEKVSLWKIIFGSK